MFIRIFVFIKNEKKKKNKKRPTATHRFIETERPKRGERDALQSVNSVWWYGGASIRPLTQPTYFHYLSSSYSCGPKTKHRFNCVVSSFSTSRLAIALLSFSIFCVSRLPFSYPYRYTILSRYDFHFFPHRFPLLYSYRIASRSRQLNL